MAQATWDQVLEQASTLSVGEQLRLIAYLAERIRTHTPATPDTSPEAAEKLTITEWLARANHKGGTLFKPPKKWMLISVRSAILGNANVTCLWLALC